MQAILNCGEGGSPRLEEVTPLDPGPDDVVVRLGASGVCHSDLSAVTGALGPLGIVVLGHEAAGVVEEVGRHVAGVAVGDRVVASFRPACGSCWFCVRDESHHCAERIALDGATARVTRPDGSTAKSYVGLGTFAEQMTVGGTSLVRVDTNLPDEQLALIGCGVSTGLGAVLNTAEVTPGSSVAVIGCGGVGQAVIQGARIAGATTVLALDPVEMKRRAAIGSGASDVADPSASDAVALARELTGGRGVDFSFEVVGSPDTMLQAHAMIRPGGTAVLVGVPRFDAEVSFNARQLQRGGKRLLGCSFGSARVRRDFQRFISFAESGQLDLASMVSRRLELEDVPEGLRALQAGEVIRSVVVPRGGR